MHEFALVEASTDNPNHLEFQNRAAAAAAHQAKEWPFSGSRNDLEASNNVLAPFGYQLAANPSPPFSGLALYRDDQLVQRDISRFWPVSVKNAEGGNTSGDFALAFETMDGEKLVASAKGIHAYPGQEQSANSSQSQVTLGNQLAYADIDSGEFTTSEALNPLSASGIADDGFGWQIIAGEQFYFHRSGDLVRMNYAGKDLAYTYDQVPHDLTGEMAVFNPGSAGQVGWFYALRDGLWYYVEVGVLY